MSGVTAWKVFERDRAEGDASDHGIVAFVTVAGFLAGPGFKPMREWLRRKCDDIYIVNLTPEGHQPPVSSRPFREVQQPVCICIAVRTSAAQEDVPATVHFRSVANGPVEDKYAELSAFRIADEGWRAGAPGWQDPFLAAPSENWASFPSLDELALWDGSGVMPGRTWVYAPEEGALHERWKALVSEPDFAAKQKMFKPHTVRGKLRDRHIAKKLADDIPGYPPSGRTLEAEPANSAPRVPTRIAFRSFDRQYLIPDKRLINQPNPSLWQVRHAHDQVFMTVVLDQPMRDVGPAATFTALVPDLHHFDGRGGRVFPLWLDATGSVSNVHDQLLDALASRYESRVLPQDVFAYFAATLAHPHYTARFSEDLATPGLRVPITADANLFFHAAMIGRKVIWLHTFGERFVDESEGRPAGSPRAPQMHRPELMTPISRPGAPLPESLDYDPDALTLTIGEGTVKPVREEVFDYRVGRMHIIHSWLDYRWAHRDTRATRNPESASPLDQITHTTWPSLFDDDLMDILNVLTLLVDLEPQQAALLDQICEGPLLTADDLDQQAALVAAEDRRTYRPKVPKAPGFGQAQFPDT